MLYVLASDKQKYMQHFFLALVLMTGILSASGQQPVHDSVAQKLNKAIADLKEKHHCPGLAIAVIHENDLVFSQALGFIDLDNNIPATIDSRFPIMSVSKTFTATMLMQLVERDIVGLHDKVTKYVPEYKVKSDYPAPVATTLFQLATHTAGLPRNTPADSHFAESFDRWLLTGGKDSLKRFSTDNELLQSLQYIKLDYPPFHYVSYNDRHYSNLGYSVLGIVLQRAAKVDFATYIVKNICRPLQMNSTGYLNEPGINARIAKGYRYNSYTSHHDKLPYIMPYSALYPGGMYSTARDMSKYISFQFQNDSRYEEVLSSDTRAMMRTFKIGWKPAFPYVVHEGALPGYRSMVAFNPDAKLGWVILTNANDIDFNAINNSFAEILNAAYKKQSNTNLSRYTGTYSLPLGYGSLTISMKNDSLYSSYLQDLLPDKAMLPEGGTRFRVEGSHGYNIGFDFDTDEHGDIISVKMGQLTWYKQ
jgi:CubicO group peptidase (beta-lactamase class C family)